MRRRYVSSFDDNIIAGFCRCSAHLAVFLADPFERGTESMEYGDWMAHRMFLIVPAQATAAKWLESFREFPPRQKPASFNLDDVMRKMTEPAATN